MEVLMQRIFEYTISKEYEGCTIFDYLLNIGYSRSIITHIKKTDMGISINNEWMYMNHKLSENEVLKVILEENSSSEHIEPVKHEFEIIFEDEDIIVINKPANMPIHPSINNYDNSLANALAYYYQSQNENFVFRCINRLDKDTSGLTIIAKNMLSATILYDMVKTRKIKREYLAIVSGKIDSAGTIDAPIARKCDSVIERCVDFEKGQTAITNFSPVISGKDYSLIKLSLKTGRTHQIRVHMKYIGHPLPGDFLYNPDYSLIKRQALHSYRLQFMHPITKEDLDFICPLPNDMKTIVDNYLTLSGKPTFF